MTNTEVQISSYFSNNLDDGNPSPCIKGAGIIESISEDAKVETGIIEMPKYVFSASVLLRREVAEVPTLLKPFLPKVGIAVMAGSSDTGKSAWLRQLVTAIVLEEEEFIGQKLDLLHYSAIYVSTEDDENSIAFLIQKQNIQKMEPERFKALRYIFETENLVKRLHNELFRMPADVVVIDTLTDVFGFNDFNNATVVRTFLHQYQKLASRYKCLVIFNHHLSKSKENGVPNKNAVLGSMAIESKARVLLELRKDRFDSSLRHLIVLKGNYLPAEVKESSVVLKFDADMIFSNTGKTEMIEDLAGNRNFNVTRELKERAAELKKQAKSVRDIVKVLFQEFNVSVGKSTVAEWVKDVSLNVPPAMQVD